jgi:hypothetical protein
LVVAVVAVVPSYFNNNQQAWLAIAFKLQRPSWVAGWLWSNPQANTEF